MNEATFPFFKHLWSRFRQNLVAYSAFILFCTMALFALLVPLLSPYCYTEIHLEQKNLPPSLNHWFGTDDLGRDLFTRVWWGTRISLFIGCLAAIIDLIIGVCWGSISGYCGGKTDLWMMRICDILHSIPYLLIVILLTVVRGSGIITILIAMTLTGWISMARIIRGHLIQLKNLDFIYAAKAIGASHFRILFYHLLPNTLGTLATMLTLTIPHAIFTEAFLSFLGLGIQAPASSLGVMIADSLSAMRFYPWRLFFPCMAITSTMLSLNIIGNALQDLLDPRFKP